jgi:hypothetical protein
LVTNTASTSMPWARAAWHVPGVELLADHVLDQALVEALLGEQPPQSAA